VQGTTLARVEPNWGVSVAGSCDLHSMPEGPESQRSVRYRIGQAVVIFVLGLALATAAMALFVHGEALNQPSPTTQHPTVGHVQKP
jgi:hypothetical protein